MPLYGSRVGLSHLLQAQAHMCPSTQATVPHHAASEGSAGLAKRLLHVELGFCHSQTVSKAEQAAPDTVCARRAVRRADWQRCFSASKAPGLISLSKA